MLRWGAMKFGGAAVTAAGAAATVGTSSEGSARIRPSQVARPDGRGAIGDAVDKDTLSDDWLPFSIEGEEVVFGREEVKEGIQDILTLANGGQVDLISDTDSVESFGADADEIIANSNASAVAFGNGAGLQTLAKFTERLLERPSIQNELLDAIRNDQEMRTMFGELAGQEGAEIELFQRPRHPALPPPVSEQGRRRGGLNFLDYVIRDIGRGLESAGDFLGKVGRWVRRRMMGKTVEEVDDTVVLEEIELGQGEKVAGAILCLAAAVMVVVVAKRMGLLRIVRAAAAAI